MHEIPVHIEGNEKRKRATGVLHILSGCFLLIGTAKLAKYNQYQHLVSLIWILAVGLGSLAYGLFRNRLDRKAKQNLPLRYLQSLCYAKLAFSLPDTAALWDKVSMVLWFVISLLLIISERRIFQPALIKIAEDGIYVPGFLRDRLLSWDSLKEIVFRKDYITLFKANGKFLQFEMAADVSDAELEEMHAFCKTRLEFSKTIESA
jgi:hypothetical protein